MRYATAAEVKSFLQLPTAFSENTTPTQTEIEAFLDYNTGLIDKETGHNFDGTGTTTETFHLKNPQYDSRDGYAIFLSNRKVQSLSALSNDSLTIFNGSTNEDYIANRTESRTGDFWLDYDLGILHIKTFRWTRPRFFSVKITYRYGESEVPAPIKKSCILLTCHDILLSDDRSILFPEGSSNIGYESKADKYQKEAYKILDKYVEYKSVGGY